MLSLHNSKPPQRVRRGADAERYGLQGMIIIIIIIIIIINSKLSCFDSMWAVILWP
jgi:hypothetical protein